MLKPTKQVEIRISLVRAGFFVGYNLFLIVFINNMLLRIRINMLAIIFKFYFFIIFSFSNVFFLLNNDIFL